MPKVTEEYIQNKKAKIIDAAYKLCLKQAVGTVTMQDINKLLWIKIQRYTAHD